MLFHPVVMTRVQFCHKVKKTIIFKHIKFVKFAKNIFTGRYVNLLGAKCKREKQFSISITN